MAEKSEELEYVDEFRASNESALAYVRKYFSLGFGLRLLNCVVSVGGVALVCGSTALIISSLIDGANSLSKDSRTFVIGVYCGLAAFVFFVLMNWGFAPFIRRGLYKQLSNLFPDERVRLVWSGRAIIWNSSKLRLEVPLDEIVAVRRSESGITIGMGGVWSRFIPASAFASSEEFEEFLRNLKQNLNPAALLRSAETFRGVEE